MLAALARADFKNSILEFEKNNIKAACKKFVTEKYLQDPKYNIDTFFKASKALGPLTKWTKSIIEYADIYERIEPLRNELSELEAEKAQMDENLAELEAEKLELEQSLERMNSEFAQLTQDKNDIEKQQGTVKRKVERSNSLYRNLSSELTRWKGSSLSFKERIASLLGDTLLSSAVLTYIGFFDYH